MELQRTKADTANSWSVDVSVVDATTCDLSVKNPNKKEEVALRDPKVILDEIQALDEQSAEILNAIRGLV